MPLYNPFGGGGSTPFDTTVDLTTLPGGGVPLQVAAVGPADGIIKLESLLIICTQTATSGLGPILDINFDSALSATSALCTAAALASLVAGRVIEANTGAINSAIAWAAAVARPVYDIASGMGGDDAAIGTVQKGGGLMLLQSRAQGLFIRVNAGGTYTAGRIRFVGRWSPVTAGATFA